MARSYRLPKAMTSAQTVINRYADDYPEGEDKGYQKWKPNKTTAQIRADIDAVLLQYWDYWPLGPRQVGYVLIGSYGYIKKDALFRSVGRILNRGRRANKRAINLETGTIRSWWAAVADGRTPDPLTPAFYDSPEDFFANVKRWGENYSTDLQDGQMVYIEIWVETASLAPQVARVAHAYGVPVYPSSGEVALLPKRDLALRAVERAKKGIQTLIFHIGDYDGDGVKIFRAFQADVMAFVYNEGHDGMVACERLAVTPEQVEHYDLEKDPIKPPKPDKNGKIKTIPGPPLPYNTQAEALNPEQLAEVIRGGIRNRIRSGIEGWQDPQILTAAQARSDTERQVVLDAVGGIELPGS